MHARAVDSKPIQSTSRGEPNAGAVMVKMTALAPATAAPRVSGFVTSAETQVTRGDSAPKSATASNSPLRVHARTARPVATQNLTISPPVRPLAPSTAMSPPSLLGIPDPAEKASTGLGPRRRTAAVTSPLANSLRVIELTGSDRIIGSCRECTLALARVSARGRPRFSVCHAHPGTRNSFSC